MFGAKLVADDLTAYMAGKNPDAELEFVIGQAGVPLPEEPDALGIVTLGAGAGTSLEQIADSPSIQIAIRGPVENPDLDTDGPLLWARQVDQYMLWMSFPSEAWGDYVFQVVRAGGAPAPITPVDDARRIIYTCTYIPTFVMGVV